ncbi:MULTISPECIES: hypothetical protein [Pseudomonas syringae group]|nr:MULTISPECIES: hypothetical protein [Pseudomonas syringae group]KPY29849.1 hypothetical protein ALO65_200248 [Pseudomonas syringae pv. papulans]MBI6746841.1 hypothetical protein [Pseudomonas syringae]MBI6795261.1 hypothetical protein [Pseudomonas syringae]MBI6807878.1 hypothetical protein [Pseudomonas syringae]MDC3739275.1 hypothetical protein [Pseudomonas syringae pv. syringae]
MTTYARQSLSVVASILLSACGGDGAHDLSPQDQMTREAMCVAASERFALYEDAKKHFVHGVDAASEYFRSSGKAAQFPKMINVARSSLVSKPNEFVATVISTMCNGQVTVGQVEDF